MNTLKRFWFALGALAEALEGLAATVSDWTREARAETDLPALPNGEPLTLESRSGKPALTGKKK